MSGIGDCKYQLDNDFAAISAFENLVNWPNPHLTFDQAVTKFVDCVSRVSAQYTQLQVDTAIGALAYVFSPIQQAIIDDATSTQKTVSDSHAAILANVQATQSAVEVDGKAIIDGLISSLRSSIDSAIESIQAQQDQITRFLIEQSTQGQIQLQAFTDAINTMNQQSVINTNLEVAALAKFDDDVTGQLSELVQLLSNYLTNPDRQTRDSIINQFVPTLVSTLVPVVTAFSDSAQRDSVSLEDVISQVTDNYIGLPLPTSRDVNVPVWLGVLLRAIIPLITFPLLLKAYADYNAMSAMQHLQRDNPIAPLSEGSIISAFLKRTIGAQQAENLLLGWGHDEGSSKTILTTAETNIQIADIFDLLWRGIIDDNETITKISQLGFNEQDTRSLFSLSDLIPPIQDIITMAVKEAFSPEIAEKFGQFEDFPEAFAEWGAKKGFSREWLLRYWAAHWNLPSPEMGFAMQQRGIISMEELQILLKALDVMPFWRDKLIQLNYRPLDRIDVRRMHALGLLDHAGLVKAYQNHGYSPTDAESLARFTEVYNATTSKLGQPRELSESKILHLYRDGILDRQGALTHLQALHYTPEDAEFIIRDLELEESLKQRKQLIDAVVSQASKHIISLADAQDRLSRMNLSSVEMDKAVSRILHAKDLKLTVPSEAELKRLFDARIITDAQAREGLAAHGYAQKWIDAIFQLWSTGHNVPTT